MRHLISIFCLVLPFLSPAQSEDYKPKFGKLEATDFEIADVDTSANAIVLYDFGKSWFDYRVKQFKFVFTYHARIKIMKESGLSKATVSIPYTVGRGSSMSESVSRIKGYTHNLVDGKVVSQKIKKSMIFKDQISKDRKVYKLSFPNAKVGSIIEYTYEITTPFDVSNKPRNWYFQQNIPVKWSEYIISYPNTLYYRGLMSGFLPLYIKEEKEALFRAVNQTGTKYRYVIKDVPAFKSEPYITTVDDYVSKIDFELVSVNWPGIMVKSFSHSYEDLNKTLLEGKSFGKNIRKNKALKEIANTIKAKNISHDQTIVEAYNWVRNTIKWNKKLSKYGNEFKKTMKKKTGDSGDINQMLIALLKKLNIKVEPVILSTRSNGSVNKYFALSTRFNHVIAMVENEKGEALLLDATKKFVQPGMLPFFALNSYGYVISKTNPRFIDIIPKGKYTSYTKINLTINEDTELEGDIKYNYGGYAAYYAKTDYEEKGKSKYIESIKKENSNLDISDVVFEYADDPAVNKFAVQYQVNTSDYITDAGKTIYIDPMLGEKMQENPFTLEKRQFPVDLGTTTKEVTHITYKLPEGATVVDIPKSAAVTLPNGGGKFSYSVIHKGETVNIVNTLHLKKTKYSSDEYFSIKELYDHIVKNHAKQLVIKLP